MVPSGLSRSANRRVIFWPGSPWILSRGDAGEVLAQVKHINAGLGLGDRPGLELGERHGPAGRDGPAPRACSSAPVTTGSQRASHRNPGVPAAQCRRAS